MEANLGPALLTFDRDIALVTLNRPEKANALNSDLLQAVLRAFDIAEGREDVRSVILRGAGQHFCAGADLGELISDGATSVRRLLGLFREVTRRCERSPLAVVAAVHGATRAGGLEIALACDAVVAEENASFGDAHLLRELLPGGGASVRLPRVVGHQRAKWMILSGKSIDAETAERWGIVHSLSAPRELLTTASQLASDLTAAKKETLAAAKAMICVSAETAFEIALENEIVVLERRITSESIIATVNSFLRGT